MTKTEYADKAKKWRAELERRLNSNMLALADEIIKQGSEYGRNMSLKSILRGFYREERSPSP
jgi:hypothetical protein